MQAHDLSPQRLQNLLDMITSEDTEREKIIPSSSFKSDSSHGSKANVDNRMSESEPANLKQQLNSYYSWTSSFYENNKEQNKPDPPTRRMSDSSFRDLLLDSSLPLYNKSKQLTEAELSVSRKRALQRLTDKRKEMDLESQRKAEQSRVNDNMPRVRWRGGIKKKRLQEIDDSLDQSILQDTINHDPTLLIKVLGSNNNHIEEGNMIDKTYDELLDGLEVDNMNLMRSPFKRFAENMKRQLLLSQSDMLYQNKLPRMRIDSSIVQPTAKLFLRKISDNMSGIVTSNLNHSDNRHNHHNMIGNDKISRNLQNKDDLNELAASDMIAEGHGESEEKKVNGSDPDDMVNNGTFDLFYRKSNRSKRSSGLLSKFVDKINVAESGDTIGIAHIAAEGGYYLIPGYYDPTSEAGAKLASDASFARYYQRFADTVFVAGPLPEDIHHLAESSSAQFYDGTNDGISSLALKLEPHTLFMTKCDEELDAQSLPKFCFPCWVNVTAKKINKDVDMNLNSSSSKKNSTSAKLPSSAKSGIGPNWNRRNNFIHPGKVYTFILSNHTRKDYAVCLSVQRSFHYPSLGVMIETEYVIAIISSFPFISYFSHLLEQFEACGGFQLNEALSVQEDGFPIIPELRSLNDLALRLNRLLVPGYNGVVPEDEAQHIQDHIVSISPQPKQQLESYRQHPFQRSVSSTDNDTKVSYLNHHGPIPFNLIFGRGPAHMKSRIDLTFKRDIFQTYYGRSDMNPTIQPELKYKNLYTPTEEQENEREREVSHHLLLWSLPILLNYLSLDDILLALGCILTEMKTIVTASDPTVLSGCVVALMSLLDPLKWVSPVIVILPDEYTEYLETPSPLIAGVESLPEGYQNSLEGVILIKPEERKVSLHVNDVVASHTLQLPRAHKLIQVIKPHVETILRLTRKAKDGLRHPHVTNASGSTSPPMAASRPGFDEPSTFDPTSSTSSASAHDQLHTLPLPLDVDVDSDRSKALLQAIKGFADEVSDHIQTIINTSLQLAWEIRRSSRHERHVLKRQTKNNTNSNTTSRTNSNNNTPGNRRNIRSDSSSISLVSDLTDGSGDYITTLTETDSTETTGSLPSVQKDAPVLPTRDIGEGGLKFIKRLQETQLYSVYCYSKSSKRKEEHEVDQVWDAYKLREHHEEDHHEEQKDSASTLNDNIMSGDALASTLSQLPTTMPAAMDENDEDSSTLYKEDPLILLFQIMLSGTMPMTPGRLDNLNEFYQPSTSIETLTQRIYWCNGRCSGLANTPFCTNICMLLWEQRVDHVRQQMRIKDVIERQHHSDLVLNTKMRVEMTDDEGYIQETKHIPIKPRTIITKHKRETESQFQLRKLEITMKANQSTSASVNISPLPSSSVSSNNDPIVAPDINLISPIEVVLSPGEGETPSTASPALNTERRVSDNVSLDSSDLQDPHDMNDELMSFDLPALPLLPRTPSMRIMVPLPSDVHASYDSYASAYASTYYNPSSAALQPETHTIPDDTQSITSLSESFRSSATLSKKDSKYSMIYQSKNDKKSTRHSATVSSSSSYSGMKRTSSFMAAAKAFTERPSSATRTPTQISSLSTILCTKKSSAPSSSRASSIIKSPPPPSIYAPRVGPNGAPSRRLYARGNAPPVIKAIASYYARKQKLRLRQHIVFALNLIETSILTYVLRKQYLHKRQAIITIQRYIRGYMVRQVYMNYYIDYLQRYKCGKILGKIIFKKWLRRHIHEIIIRFRCHRQEMLNKRLSNQHAQLPAAAKSSLNLYDSIQKSLSATFPPPTSSTGIGSDSNAYSAPTTPHLTSASSSKSSDSVLGIAIPTSSVTHQHSIIRHLDSSDSDQPLSISTSPAISNRFSGIASDSNKSSINHMSDTSSSTSTRSFSPLPPTTSLSRQSSIDHPPSISTSTPRFDTISSSSAAVGSEQHVMSLSHEDIYAHRNYDAINTIEDEEFMFKDEDDDSLIGPLRSLGPEAQDALTPQQKTILIDMWSLLCKGVEIMKHGRSGRPKQRFLYCDDDMTKLVWRPNRVINGQPNSAGRHSTDNPMGSELTAGSLAFAKPPRPHGYGHMMKSSSASFMDDGASETASNYGSVNGNHHSQGMKISNFYFKKRDSERELFFRDILQVCDDMSTVVMRRASAKSYLATDHKANISIVVADRTLDFEIDKVYWERIYHALQVLVNYYRVILPSSHHTAENSSPLNPTTSTTVAGVSYHHRSSKRHHTSRRAFQSKTPLVISEAVQVNNSGKHHHRGGGVQADIIGDDWNHVDADGNDDSDYDVDSDAEN